MLPDGSVHTSNGVSTSTFARRRARVYKKSETTFYVRRAPPATLWGANLMVQSVLRVCAQHLMCICFANSPPQCGWGGRRRGRLQWLRSAVEDQPPPDTPSWRAPRPPCAGPRCTRGTRKAPDRPARSSPCNTHKDRRELHLHTLKAAWHRASAADTKHSRDTRQWIYILMCSTLFQWVLMYKDTNCICWRVIAGESLSLGMGWVGFKFCIAN